jgi:hypothetical protein
MSLDNPAGRLHAILSDGKAKPSKEPAAKTWAALLRVDESDFVTLLQKLGLVHQLPAAVRQRIEKVDGFNPDIHLRWIPSVELAFKKLHLYRPWGEFIERIDDASLLALQVCDHELSKQGSTNIGNDQIDALKLEAESLRESISEADTALEVEDYLLSNLGMIEKSLCDYYLSGPESIRNAVQITIGSIAGNVNIYQQSQESEAGKAFWAFVRKLALILEIIAATVAIGGFVSTLSLAPSEASSEEHRDKIEPSSHAVFRDDSSDTDRRKP